MSKQHTFPAARRSLSVAIFYFAIAAILSGLTSPASAQLAEIAEEPEKYPSVTERKAYKRAEWAFEQRAFPAREVPSEALERGFDEVRRFEEVQAQRALQSSNARDSDGPERLSQAGLLSGVVSQWVNIGPAPMKGSQYQHNNSFDANLRVSGRVSAIAVDPRNADRWIIGSAQGGIWVTENAGVSWSPKSDGMPSLAIGALRIVPVAPDTIYAGTGEPVSSDAYGGVGLLKSTDGGNTWQHITQSAAAFKGNAISEIRVHPSDAQLLVVASSSATFGKSFSAQPASPPARGIYRSTNGGQTWSKTFPAAVDGSSDATDLEVDPTNFANQFAAISNPSGSADSGVYRSTNAGESWALINGPWTNSTNFPGGVGRIEMAIAPGDSNVLYVSIQDRNDPDTNPAIPENANDNRLLGIWKTTNALAPAPDWVQLPPAAGTNNMWYNHQLAVSPTDSRVLYVGEVRLLKYDGRPGAELTWSNRTANLHADQHALAFSSGRLIVGNDGGVFYRNDEAATLSLWTHCNTNLSITQFYDGSIHPSNKDFAIGGAQDNGTARYDGGNGWGFINFGDGAANAISNSRPDTDWAVSSQNLSIRRTIAGGAIPGPTPGSNFTIADAGITDNGDDGANNRAPFIAKLEKHPSNDDVFIAGTNNIWRSNNFFSGSSPSWSQNSDNQTHGISALAFAPSDSTANTYAFGTAGGILRLTTEGGGTTAAGTAARWKNLDPSNQVPQRYVTDLAFASTDASTMYVTLSGFNENTPGAAGHVFRTRNARDASPAWENISPPVNMPANTIVIDPLHPQVIYVGTDLGVWEGYQENSGNVIWTHLGPSTGMPNVAVYDLKLQSNTRRLFAFTHGRGVFVADLFPPNNHVESARIISGASGRIVDTNINATLESGEPDHFPGTAAKGDKSVWFLWQAPITGQAVLDTVESNFDTDLAVYTVGSGWNGVTLPAVASDNNSGGGAGTSRVTFPTTAGTLYYIAINGSAAGNAGFYALNWSVSDSTVPQVAITSPVHNAVVDALAAISGTASDSSGIKDNKVNLTLRHTPTGDYWNGTNWVGSSSSLTATVNGSGAWSYTSVPTDSNLRQGQYYVTADATDRANNFSAVRPGVNRTNFIVDSVAPQIAITTPAPFTTINGLVEIRGTASDLIGQPKLFIIRYSDGAFWTAAGWASGQTAELPTTYNASTRTWVNAGPLPQVDTNDPDYALTDGSYNIIAFAHDENGHETRTDSVVYVEVNAPVNVAVTSPASGSVINGLPAISGTASDVVQAVKLFIVRLDDYRWWNGSQWVTGSAELPTHYDAATHRWSNATNLPNTGNDPTTSLASGTYNIFALAYDGRGGEPVRHDIFVRVDRAQAPAVAITNPANGDSVPYLFGIGGTASEVVDGINLYIYRFSDGKYWDGNAWGGGGSAILPIQYDRAAGTWQSAGNLPDSFGTDPDTSFTDGSYDIIAIGYDSAGGQARSDSVIFIDKAGPTLVSFELSPATVDVSTEAKIVTGTARITDAAGADGGVVRLLSPDGTREFTAFFGEYDRVSGTAKDGVYSFQFYLPRFLEPGSWTAILDLYDSANNFSTYGGAEGLPMPAGAVSAVSVLNTAGVDRENPVLVSLSFSPSPVDVTSAAQQVSVTAEITDDLAGLHYTSLALTSPSGQRVIYSGFDAASRISGTATAGTYRYTMTLPRSIEPGAWKVSLYVTDSSDRAVHYYSPDGVPFPAGTSGELMVVNSGAVDAADPALSNLQITPLTGATPSPTPVASATPVTSPTPPPNPTPVITPTPGAEPIASAPFPPGGGTPTPPPSSPTPTPGQPTVDVTSSSQQVSITFQVNDDVSGLDYGYFDLVSPTGVQYVGMKFDAAQRTSGSPTAGTYGFVLTIPRYAQPGTWKVQMSLYDQSQNSVRYGGFFGPQLPQTLTVVNTGAVDTAGPVLSSVTYSPTKVNVANTAQQITVTMDISDAPAGFKEGAVGFYAPSDTYGYGTPTHFSPAQRISGTATSGVYQAVFTIPHNAELGDWKIGLALGDEAGNWRYYGAASYYAEPLVGAVTVARDDNDRPVANLGPDISVTVGETVRFEGSFSDPDVGDSHTASWTFGEGGTAAGTLVPVYSYGTPGSYVVTFTVTDQLGATGSDTLLVTVNPPPPTYTDWSSQAFPPNAPAAAKADTADIDGDGISNLAEYAFNMSPTSSSLDGLPTLGTTTAPGASAPASELNAVATPRYLTLTYRRRIGSMDLTYIVAASSDLVTWDKSQASVEQVGAAVPVGDGESERVTVKYTQPIGAVPKQFLRVEVQKQ